MKYFVFDMDETLAELYSVYYFVASLRLNEMYKEVNESKTLPEHLKKSLRKAYDKFVQDVLEEETSDNPLGILRPGILDVMTNLDELRKLGKVKNVLIYSNNGHLESLEFIRDLIHRHLGTSDLIGECIHWNHHMRDEERTLQPGSANKTWNVLRNIMVKGNCKASEDIEPKDVLFFDDLFHKDLIKNLSSNYYKVPAYTFKASFDRLSEIYRNAIQSTSMVENEFLKYVVETFSNSKVNSHLHLDYVIGLFRNKTKGTAEADTKAPNIDEGIIMMLEAVKKVGQEGGRKRKILVVETRKRKFRRFRKKRKTQRKN